MQEKTGTLLLLQADLKQTLFNNKNVKVKLIFKANIVVKPLTLDRNAVVFRPH